MPALPSHNSQESIGDLPSNRLLNSVEAVDETLSSGPVVYGFDAGPFTLLHDPFFPSEVLEDIDVTSIPNTDAWFHGMVAVRGHLVPIWNINEFVSVSNKGELEIADSKIVIVGTNEEAAGICIRSLPTRVKQELLVPRDDLRVLGILEPAIRNTYFVGKERWLDVDYPYLFELIGEQLNRAT